MRKLLVASSNQGKIREIKDFLGDLGYEVVGPGGFTGLTPVVEDGNTFKENALKKARTRAQETGLLTLADDSGLEVDYLEGRPGIYSARFAGADATDRDNNRKLLQELKGVPREKRQANFKCVAALVDPENDRELTVTGTCQGIILEKPRGDQGFGYDPLFYVPEYEKTMAELPLEIKNKISHRAHALRRLKNVLKSS